ncbi:DUF6234 family protein [Streptomyces sp. NPDC006265]|uniref:DUF6234 family protein n=1 Tax=Streptomyces sp. NPDC006265 TaxID=3156740 RepID=UPI0033A8425F
MRFERSARVPRLPENDGRPGKPLNVGGDGFAGGCISLIVLLIEIPVALLLGLTSAIRGWGSADEQTVASAMDWVPILWFGGFTLGVLVIAVIFLCSAHPFAGAAQLLLAAVALFFTIAAWHDEYERAHPSPSPTGVGMSHAPSHQGYDGCPPQIAAAAVAGPVGVVPSVRRVWAVSARGWVRGGR